MVSNGNYYTGGNGGIYRSAAAVAYKRSLCRSPVHSTTATGTEPVIFIPAVYLYGSCPCKSLPFRIYGSEILLFNKMPTLKVRIFHLCHKQIGIIYPEKEGGFFRKSLQFTYSRKPCPSFCFTYKQFIAFEYKEYVLLGRLTLLKGNMVFMGCNILYHKQPPSKNAAEYYLRHLIILFIITYLSA